jgi:hypothetical protein
MGAVVSDYLMYDARNQHDFKTMNGQNGQLQFDTKQNNLRFYAHGQLCFEETKVAIAWGKWSQGMDGKLNLW